MSTNRFYAKSTCLLVGKGSNMSKPERSLWHYDQLYAGGVQLRVKRRKSKAKASSSCLDLPKTLPGHLTLLTAEVFEPEKLQQLAHNRKGRSRPTASRLTARLELTPRTAMSFLFPEYRLVLSIGLAESLFVVSPTSGRIAFDMIPQYIHTLLKQLVSPILFDGHIQFEPTIHLSVVATTPTRAFICVLQGRIVDKTTVSDVARYIETELSALVQTENFRKVRRACGRPCSAEATATYAPARRPVHRNCGAHGGHSGDCIVLIAGRDV